MTRELYKNEKRHRNRVETTRNQQLHKEALLIAEESAACDAADICTFARLRLKMCKAAFDDVEAVNQPLVDDLKKHKSRAIEKLDKLRRKSRKACESRNGTKVDSFAGRIHECRIDIQGYNDRIHTLITEIIGSKEEVAAAQTASDQADIEYAAREQAVKTATAERDAARKAHAEAVIDHEIAQKKLDEAQRRRSSRAKSPSKQNYAANAR